jgi:hypothetical protein
MPFPSRKYNGSFAESNSRRTPNPTCSDVLGSFTTGKPIPRVATKSQIIATILHKESRGTNNFEKYSVDNHAKSNFEEHTLKKLQF